MCTADGNAAIEMKRHSCRDGGGCASAGLLFPSRDFGTAALRRMHSSQLKIGRPLGRLSQFPAPMDWWLWRGKRLFGRPRSNSQLDAKHAFQIGLVDGQEGPESGRRRYGPSLRLCRITCRGSVITAPVVGSSSVGSDPINERGVGHRLRDCNCARAGGRDAAASRRGARQNRRGLKRRDPRLTHA